MGITSRIDEVSAGAKIAAAGVRAIEIDPFRMFSFPNALRERRVAAGFPSLLGLSQRLPDIPYIRLSKIERGEVFARADELCRIAHALGLVDPDTLLIDVDEPGFSLKKWVGPRAADHLRNLEAEELAMLLAAALRRVRSCDPMLTLARLLEEYRLAAVIVSRIENAVKPFDRWNAETINALADVFGVTDRKALISFLRHEHQRGSLDEWLARIPGAREREARSRERIAALRTELSRMEAWALGAEKSGAYQSIVGRGAKRSDTVATLQVVGVPLGDGLIEPFPSPQTVTPPSDAGPQCYALRMCRASLGAAIPANAVLIVDPDRMPAHHGIVVLKEGEGLRVLALSTDKNGRLIGNSSNPEKEILLDSCSYEDMAMVTAILYP